VTSLYFDGVAIVDLPDAGPGAVHVAAQTSAATSVAWSPDGTALAASFYDAPHLVVYRRTVTDLTSWELPLQPGTASSIAWSPDGRAIATAGGDIARVFDARSGAISDQFLTRDAYEPNIVWARAGNAVASADDGQVLIFPLGTATPSARWSCPQDYFGSRVLAWAEDGRLLTQGGADRIVRVWQYGSAEPVSRWAVSAWQVLVG